MQRVTGLRRGLMASAMAFCVVWPAVSVAQQPSAENIQREQQFERAFQDMLRDPSNLDKTFRYAEIAIQTGDYEAAISALERMLLFNPDLPRVRLELGVLYFRLGSYAIARTYLNRALEGPNVPDDVRSRVAVYLEEIEKRTSRHRFAGSVYGGVRYQTNANSGPEREAIRLLGGEAALDGRFTRKNDWNAFISANLRHTYDPQLQTGEVFETDVLLYHANHTSQHQVDLLFAELTAGPRGEFFRERLQNVSYRPYILLSETYLEESTYFFAYGGGINFQTQLAEGWVAELNFQHKQKNYEKSAERPRAADQDAGETEFRADVRYRLTDRIILSGAAQLTLENADESLYSNREVLATVGYTQSYDAPFGLTQQPWTTSFTITYVWTEYHEPDPAVDPLEAREDGEWRFNLLTAVPIDDQWSIIGTVQRVTVDSKFRNFTYNNTAASLGASYRF